MQVDHVAQTTFSMTAQRIQFAREKREKRWHEERVIGRDISLPQKTLSLVEELETTALLDEFANLPENWDGYGALPIDTETIDNCRAALVGLQQRARGPNIEPNPNGTISFEWISERGAAYLEIGKTRFSFFVKSAEDATILREGGASKVPVEIGDVIAAIVFPPVRSVAAITKLIYMASHEQATY